MLWPSTSEPLAVQVSKVSLVLTRGTSDGDSPGATVGRWLTLVDVLWVSPSSRPSLAVTWQVTSSPSARVLLPTQAAMLMVDVAPVSVVKVLPELSCHWYV